MNRRELLGSALALPLAAWAKSNKIDRSRISTITDENAKSPAEAIAFAKQYNLRWVELRAVPGAKKHYADLTDAELKSAHKEFSDNGIAVSFFNSGQCKYLLPGTTPLKPRQEAPDAAAARLEREKKQFESRIAELRRSIHAAQALGTDKVRVFAFARTVDPAKDMQRIVDVLGEMVKVAEKEGVRLLLENEVACNVGRCDEMAAYMKAIPSKAFGLNWDPLNGRHLGEEPFPNGYKLLPLKKLWNVQIKGKSILKGYGEDWLDWAGIFSALEGDGYKDEIGLECHIFGAEQIAKSHESMKEILRVAEHRS